MLREIPKSQKAATNVAAFFVSCTLIFLASHPEVRPADELRDEVGNLAAAQLPAAVEIVNGAQSAGSARLVVLKLVGYGNNPAAEAGSVRDLLFRGAVCSPPGLR